MNFIKKLLSMPTGQTKTVDAAEVWVVSWKSRHGNFHSDTYRKAEAFFSNETANEFVQRLKDAQRFLGNTHSIDIRVRKQGQSA